MPKDDCRIIAVSEFDGTKPVLVSTSRHIASPIFEVMDERWDTGTKTHSGTSTVVPGEAYELRVAVPEGMSCSSAGAGEIAQSGRELRVRFRPSGEKLSWTLSFR